MIGDGYFRLRAQIGTSLFTLAKLTRDLDAPESAGVLLQDLQGQLREPFTFLAFGPPGGGKSSLLNALFGFDFAGGADSADRAVLYCHGAEVSDKQVEDGFTTAERPHIFLRDFTLVDPPGLRNAEEVSPVLRRFLGTADLVLAVFAVGEDGGGAWDFLARMEGESLRRFVFVVQQADRVASEELPLHVKRLRHTMLTRLSLACPIFAVSAQTRAGMEKLERYIDEQVVGSPFRAQKLIEICGRAQALLNEISTRPRLELEAVEARTQEYRERHLVLQDRKDESLRQIAGEHWSLAQAFDAAEKRGIHILQRSISWLGLLRQRRGWETAFQREVDERLRDAVARQLETTFEHTNIDLHEALETHREALEFLGGDGTLDLPLDRTALLGIFTHALGERDQEGAVTPRLATRYARARSLFRLPALLTAVSALTAAGSLAAPRYFQFALGVFIVIASASWLASFLLQRDLASEVARLIARQREKVITGIEKGVREEIERFYAVLAATLQPLEKIGETRRESLAPLMERVEALGRLFDEAVADLCRPAAPASVPARPPG